MEKEINIKTKDGHIVYGTLNWMNKTDKLIIFVHGLTGHKDEHIFYNAAKFFPQKGIATFRFDLYNGNKKGRRLSECTIHTHAEDVNAVVVYFAKKFKRIYLIGHSLGAPSLIFADTPVAKAIVLWDPASVDRSMFDPFCKYNEKLDAYIIDWGTQAIMSKQMYNEMGRNKEWLERLKKIKIPIKIIAATEGDAFLRKSRISYFKYANEPKQIVFIKNTGHTFSEEGAEEKLFKETLDWIKKY